MAEEREKERRKRGVYMESDGKRTTDIACLTMFNNLERFVRVHFGNAILRVRKQ